MIIVVNKMLTNLHDDDDDDLYCNSLVFILFWKYIHFVFTIKTYYLTHIAITVMHTPVSEDTHCANHCAILLRYCMYVTVLISYISKISCDQRPQQYIPHQNTCIVGKHALFHSAFVFLFLFFLFFFYNRCSIY